MRLIINRLTGFIILTMILVGNFSAFAQTKRSAGGQIAANQKDTGAKACSSGYNGSVKYAKIVQTSANGRNGSFSNMKRTYQTTINIRDDGRQEGSLAMSETGLTGSFNMTGQASGSLNETDERLDITEKDDYCQLSLAGAKDKTRVRCEGKWNRTTNAAGTTGDASVYIGIRGNKMDLSLGSLPVLNGALNEVSNSRCTGTCGKDSPVNLSRSGEVTGVGERSAATDDQVIEFNPVSFNRLSGTWSKSEPTPGGTVTETFTWNLSRCAPPLEIDNLRFEQKRVRKPSDWIGVDLMNGVYDGNTVKIKATVFNNGGDTAYATVKFTETKSGEVLPNGTISVSVSPGESREVEYDWDTNGYAWDENQNKVLEREIKAQIEGGSTSAKIKILPKPIVLVHGLWSNAGAWADWHRFLREAHSFAWEAFPVGEDPFHGKMNTGDHPANHEPTYTIFQNAQELAKQIKWVREQKNAQHVDLVAHSMGGLISRFYIHNMMQPVDDGKPEATHLVMLGTPNQGSACADLMYGFYLNNPIAEKPVEALRQLKPSVVEEYNRKTYNRKNVKFSILAGYGVPLTCGAEIGDIVVPLSSALYNIGDRGYAATHHLALTDEKYFKSFVFPRLAVGPKKSRAEQTTAWLDQLNDENYAFALRGEQRNQHGFADYFKTVSYQSKPNAASDDTTANDDPKNLTVRRAVKLAPKQTTEIEIPVRDGASAGVVLIAMPGVAAALSDERGAIVGESPIYKSGKYEYFRTIAAEQPVISGTWKLKLENASTEETTIFVAGFTNSSSASKFTVTAGKPNAVGHVPLVAELTANSQPVLNAKITANIAGQTASIEFFDDGRHGDGAAGDGVYGAMTEKLPRGEHFAEARAEANQEIKIAIVQITTGIVSPPIQTKRRGK